MFLKFCALNPNRRFKDLKKYRDKKEKAWADQQR